MDINTALAKEYAMKYNIPIGCRQPKGTARRRFSLILGIYKKEINYAIRIIKFPHTSDPGRMG